jgi:hypothetical protein
MNTQFGLGVVIDEGRVGGSQGVSAQVVLLHPEQLIAVATVLVVTDHRLDPDIACFGHQDRREGNGQVTGAGLGPVLGYVTPATK